MNSLARTGRSIRGEDIDRVPTFPILIAPSCELLGVKQGAYSQDPQIMARTLIEARDLCDFDGIYVSRDNWVIHEALGGRVVFPEDDESYSTETLLGSVGDFKKLIVPDPENAPGMRTLLQAARIVVKKAGDEYYIQANIDSGPFSLAGILIGVQDFMMALATEDENLIHGLLEFCTEVVIAYGRAMIATGVHGIQYGDSIASLIGEDMYRKFVLPYQHKSIDALSGLDCDLWIHICGKTDHLLGLLKEVNIQGFEVDAMVEMAEAKELLGDRIAIKGNVDTTFLLTESPEAVYKATQDCIMNSGCKTGIILSPGCGVPRMTPLENLRAMVRACRDYELS